MENKLKDTRSLALVSAVVLFVMQMFGINNFTHILMLLGYGVLAFSVYKNRKDMVALAGTGILVFTGLIQLFMNFSLANIFGLLAYLSLFAMILIDAVPSIDKEDVIGRIPENLRGYVVYIPAGMIALSAVVSFISLFSWVIRYGAFVINFSTVIFVILFGVVMTAGYLFISMWAMNIVVSNNDTPDVNAEDKQEIVKPVVTSAPMTDNEMYIDLALHVILLLATCGIWQLIWIYRTTKALNKCQGEEYRDPAYKLLLCMFIPFYYIYWTYKSAQRVDKMYAQCGTTSDIATLCLILSIFIGIVPPILIQMKINGLADKHAGANEPQPQKTVQETPKATESNIDVAEEIRKFKELLDNGASTQEEYEAKKKQLLDI